MSIKYNGNDVKEINYKEGSNTYNPNVLVYNNDTSWSKEVGISFDSVNVNISGATPTRVTSGNLEDRSDPDLNVTRKSPTAITFTDSNVDTQITNANGVARYNDSFNISWSLPTSSKYHFYMDKVTDNVGNTYTSSSGAISAKIGLNNTFTASAGIYEQATKIGAHMASATYYSSVLPSLVVSGKNINGDYTQLCSFSSGSETDYQNTWLPITMTNDINDPRGTNLVKLSCYRSYIPQFKIISEDNISSAFSRITSYDTAITYNMYTDYFKKDSRREKIQLFPVSLSNDWTHGTKGTIVIKLQKGSPSSGASIDFEILTTVKEANNITYDVPLLPWNVDSADGCHCFIWYDTAHPRGIFVANNFSGMSATVTLQVSLPKLKIGCKSVSDSDSQVGYTAFYSD